MVKFIPYERFLKTLHYSNSHNSWLIFPENKGIMNTLSLTYQLWNHVVDEFCQFGRICINSNFIHKAFYITQLQADRLQFCIKHIYLYLNMITTLQRRKWNSEKLQDHINWCIEKMNSDLWVWGLGPCCGPCALSLIQEMSTGHGSALQFNTTTTLSLAVQILLGVTEIVDISQHLFYPSFTVQHLRDLDRTDFTLT